MKSWIKRIWWALALSALAYAGGDFSVSPKSTTAGGTVGLAWDVNPNRGPCELRSKRPKDKYWQY